MDSPAKFESVRIGREITAGDFETGRRPGNVRLDVEKPRWVPLCPENFNSARTRTQQLDAPAGGQEAAAKLTLTIV